MKIDDMMTRKREKPGHQQIDKIGGMTADIPSRLGNIVSACTAALAAKHRAHERA